MTNQEFNAYVYEQKRQGRSESQIARSLGMSLAHFMGRINGVDVDKVDPPKQEAPKVEKKPEITLEDFDKVQIQVGEVLKCEKVKKAKKLLCSQIRVGDEVRQIVSGISLHYTPEEMVGKKVAVITNLKPAKLCGLLSEGMILAAADDDGNMSVLTLDKDIISGSEI